jgi:hypothetical protein
MAADTSENTVEDDIIIPATDANKAMMVEVYHSSCFDEAEMAEALEALDNEKDEIVAWPWMLLDYFATRCKALSKT